jgi:D-arabinose 1-dehydrogenase-like Zn-dependent alcohol dehydrogenase
MASERLDFGTSLLLATICAGSTAVKNLTRSGHIPCHRVRAIGRRHLASLDDRIARLQRFRLRVGDALRRLRSDGKEKAAKKVVRVTVVKASQPDAKATVTYDPVKTTLEAVARAINAVTPFKAEAPRNTPTK